MKVHDTLPAPACPAKPPISALDLAALQVASKPLAQCRGELAPGSYAVDLTVRLTGGLTVRPDAIAATPGDMTALAAWALSRLPRRHQRRLVALVNEFGKLEVSEEERQLAQSLAASTRGQTLRRGAISGTVTVREVER